MRRGVVEVGLRIAALVKQIPEFEAMTLGADGRLVRDGIALEMNAYCRRAVAKAVELAGDQPGSSVTVITLGPPSAEDCLREAIAWGLEHHLEAIDGVLVSDPAFAGSDTLATATALAATIRALGPFDLILCGRNSVDADTGQVGPQLAELLDLPFMTGVRHLAVDAGGTLSVRCEHDDGWLQATLSLPALLSCAERLCEPCKVDPAGRAAVERGRLRRLAAGDLGAGPWGAAASPTSVGPVRLHEASRAARTWPELSLERQVEAAVDFLRERGAFDAAAPRAAMPLGASNGVNAAAPIAVLVEPNRERLTRELLGAASRLARDGAAERRVTALTMQPNDAAQLANYGADDVVVLDGALVEEDVAAAVAAWAREAIPDTIVAPSTAWGREVASRVSATLGAGLTGDAVALETDPNGRLVAWKPAFGGQLVAAILCSSRPQMATVRAGVLAIPAPRVATPSVEHRSVTPRHRITVLARSRDDDLDLLAEARAVIAVGKGVDPARYGQLEALRAALGAEIGATRKVTDEGWLPRARQIGITGRSIAPRLLVSVAASGKFNHTIGFRSAEHVLAVNTDAAAPIFACADAGIIGPWERAVPLLAAQLASPAGFGGRQ